MPRHIIINLLKTKDKEDLKEAREKMAPYLLQTTDLYVRRFLIGNHESQREVIQYFSSPERKEHLTQNPTHSANIFAYSHMACGILGISVPSQDQTHALCIGGTES